MTSSPSQTILYANDRYELLIASLLGSGIRFDPEDYASLNACVQRGFTRLGIKMLDMGMDFDTFRERMQGQSGATENKTFKELAAHWEDTHHTEPEQGQSM